MFKAVIFDMDGVIVDSEPAHYAADNALFEMLGIKLTSDERALFLGVSSEWMWNYILSKYPLNISKREILELDISVRSKFLLTPNLPEVNPGLLNLLQRIQDEGLLIAVASSTVSIILKQLLKELDLLKYFSQIAAGDQVKNAKPEPDVFLLASALLQLAPSQCLVIEDSPNGIKAAKSAGMKCLAYAHKLSDNKLMEADSIINSFDQLTFSLMEKVYNKFS
jgi:HAD superfamily hydrolase (TIGR01509 family)